MSDLLRERTSAPGVVLLLACEIAVVRVLPSLGSMPPAATTRAGLWRWLETAPVDDVVTTFVWLLATAAAWWLLLSTVAYLAANLARWRPGAEALARVTAGPVRRLVNGACAMAIAGSSVVGGAPGASAREVSDVPMIEQPYQPTPAGDVYPPPPAASSAPHGGDASVPAYRVVPDDNLWTIAHATLRDRAQAADLAATRAYWLKLIALNRSRLRSGDPNLIYPGEEIRLPGEEGGRT